jgi:hypothetical protein
MMQLQDGDLRSKGFKKLKGQREKERGREGERERREKRERGEKRDGGTAQTILPIEVSARTTVIWVLGQLSTEWFQIVSWFLIPAKYNR